MNSFYFVLTQMSSLKVNNITRLFQYSFISDVNGLRTYQDLTEEKGKYIYVYGL